MKVIKHGSNRNYRKECNQCDSIIEYNHSDLRCKYSEDISFLKGRKAFSNKIYIMCPVCRTKIIISTDDYHFE